MVDVDKVFDFTALGALRGRPFLAPLIGLGTGIVMTELISSSTASIGIVMVMTFNNIIPFEMAAGMVLGANLGTTTSALLAALAGNTVAKRTALSHVLFNLFGVFWALPLIIPLLKLVDIILPGDPWAVIPGGNTAIPLHLAGLHTAFNTINTFLFLPFIHPYAKLLTLIIPDKKVEEEKDGRYKFAYISSAITDSPELNIFRAEKEISDMAGIVSSMYSRFTEALRNLRETGVKDTEIAEKATALCTELEKKEQYIDEMREVLSGFLIECSRMQSNAKTEQRIAYLMRVIGNLEEMSDECYSISRLLEKSIRKNCVFKDKEMDELIPYVNQVEEFLVLLEKQLGRSPTKEYASRAVELEASIDKNRKKLHKMGRKRIEAGGDVRTELLFIDLVRRIEKLGDYCFEISEHSPIEKVKGFFASRFGLQKSGD
jgi:phosphate:Na+ symporter